MKTVLRMSTALSAILFGLIVVAVLADFAFRHLGLSVVIGLERVEYLLLVSVLAALPGLSGAGGHVALQWSNTPSPLRSRAIGGLIATLCLALGLRYADLALEAWRTGAHFRRSLDVPEAPVWAAAALAFALAGIAALVRSRS
ncbi:hypothetical protein [Stappia stellulata]|uniref:hypothetical protein n=1 Tax=Stappia stellulata TaxID=71235 RepID=UPI001AD8FC0C|nr:hypothetical protein [Stappia stellulata]